MNIQEIIIKKRDKKELSEDEIYYFVDAYTRGEITDYHAAALMMAIYLNGMTKQETINLTLAMAKSGQILDLSDISNCIIDKHSTGGVGDKITLILVPIIASLGMYVAKMSGRGLGFTGGTADKLESIPGYETSLSLEEFKNNVKEIGISLATQTEDLAPADKKIYGLRDAIGCVDSIPLIASSIMSKKIASGADKIVLEVMVGSGAFMKTKEDALELCKQMQEIGLVAGKEIVCVLTNMNEPIGTSVGNFLEIIETTEALRGNISKDVEEVVCTLGAYAIKIAGLCDDIEANKIKIKEQIYNGKGLEKWRELIIRQNGNIEYIDNIDLMPKAKFEMQVISEKSGYVKELDARKIGEISAYLGAGRIQKEDIIDKNVGIVFNKKIGDYVEKGEKLATIYANDEEKGLNAVKHIKEVYKYADEEVGIPQMILDVIM